jgi:hypothetical protein
VRKERKSGAERALVVECFCGWTADNGGRRVFIAGGDVREFLKLLASIGRHWGRAGAHGCGGWGG